MIEYTGVITYVRFYSEETKFIVASFKADQEDKPINITGNIVSVNKDDRYKITGDYVMHPRYGKQFSLKSYEVLLADNKEEIIRYLSSSLFKGIGEKQAEVIVDTLGEDCLTLIKNDPSCLNIVRGMTQKKVEAITLVLQNQDYNHELLTFFMAHDISTRYLALLEDVYKEKTLEIIKENPYRLMDDIEGIGFKSADTLAKKMKFDMNSSYRKKACIQDALIQICFKTGSVFTTIDKIENYVYKSIQMTHDEFLMFIDELIEDHKIIIDKNRYYPLDLYNSEESIASLFKKFESMPKYTFDENDIKNKIKELEDTQGIIYDDIQKEAILTFLKEPALILTGGPGTGKTTIVLAILKMFSYLYPHKKIDLVAPTGRASKRLAQLTKLETSTIHRLLKWDLHTNSFAKNSEFPLDTELLVIDEFSMVDSLLFSKVLEAGIKINKILLIGDDKQLPSVSPGLVLKDLIDSSKVPVIKLETIYRQSNNSGIINIAHSLRNNYFNREMFKSYEDTHFIEAPSYEVVGKIIGLVTTLLEEGEDINDIQVLAPMYQGVAGIDAINEAMQIIINPESFDKRELKIGRRIFREGDKVLQLKNRVEDNVFNGDIGYIVEIDDNVKEKKITVEYEYEYVTYTSSEFNEITHAYCMSIHKSQGNEFPIVIMSVLSDYYIMMRKNLIYTGITRAKKELYVIGDMNVFEKGILRDDDMQRQTSLKEKLGVQEIKLTDFI